MQMLAQHLGDTLIGGMILVTVQVTWTFLKTYISGE